MESKQGHILSKFDKIPISLAFFKFPHLWGHWPQQTTAPTLSPKTPQFPQQGFPPKESPLRLPNLAPIKPPGMQLKPGNKTDSKLCLFHPTKNPQACTKFCLINTQILHWCQTVISQCICCGSPDKKQAWVGAKWMDMCDERIVGGVIDYIELIAPSNAWRLAVVLRVQAAW